MKVQNTQQIIQSLVPYFGFREAARNTRVRGATVGYWWNGKNEARLDLLLEVLESKGVELIAFKDGKPLPEMKFGKPFIKKSRG